MLCVGFLTWNPNILDKQNISSDSFHLKLIIEWNEAKFDWFKWVGVCCCVLGSLNIFFLLNLKSVYLGSTPLISIRQSKSNTLLAFTLEYWANIYRNTHWYFPGSVEFYYILKDLNGCSSCHHETNLSLLFKNKYKIFTRMGLTKF